MYLCCPKPPQPKAPTAPTEPPSLTLVVQILSRLPALIPCGHERPCGKRTREPEWLVTLRLGGWHELISDKGMKSTTPANAISSARESTAQNGVPTIHLLTLQTRRDSAASKNKRHLEASARWKPADTLPLKAVHSPRPSPVQPKPLSNGSQPTRSLPRRYTAHAPHLSSRSLCPMAASRHAHPKAVHSPRPSPVQPKPLSNGSQLTRSLPRQYTAHAPHLSSRSLCPMAAS
ncbi:hypothetical protein P7K49_036955 [Saguinus oedipus]|uniref:Uncharacterized protein n=1 Tax=Saguinus oedipus TaxID=9490 RepID=A0ABQ9TLL7_SAGOE|nr:hypothetical protein P7K49_036955 [Saguinus oedipus]